MKGLHLLEIRQEAETSSFVVVQNEPPVSNLKRADLFRKVLFEQISLSSTENDMVDMYTYLIDFISLILSCVKF